MSRMRLLAGFCLWMGAGALALAQGVATPAPPAGADSPTTATKSAQPPGLYALFETSLGAFRVRLFEKEAPQTVQSFVDLAEGRKAHLDPSTGAMVTTRLFDGRKIFRVIRDFMFQTGSASDDNTYQPGFNLPDEVVPSLGFTKPGLLAMANTGRPNSGGCQFFVTLGVDRVKHLTGKYTIFGEVVEGMDVVQKIGAVPVQLNQQREMSLPLEPPVLRQVVIERVK